MKIVIDIPEEEYALCKKEWDTECLDTLMIAVKYGTPLPKGHGRLIDACEAEKVMMDVMCGTGHQYDAMRVLSSDFYTPTIIEADGGVE